MIAEDYEMILVVCNNQTLLVTAGCQWIGLASVVFELPTFSEQIVKRFKQRMTINNSQWNQVCWSSGVLANGVMDRRLMKMQHAMGLIVEQLITLLQAVQVDDVIRMNPTCTTNQTCSAWLILACI